MLDKPKITSVTLTYDSHDTKTNTAYYGFDISVENVVSDWDYRKTIFNKLKEITPEDLINALTSRNWELPNDSS